MPSVNEKIADEIRSHSVMLARYTEGQKTMIFRRVNSIFKKLKEQTADAEIFTGTVKQRKRAIDALFQRAEKEISQAYESIGKQVDLNLYDLAELETGWTRKLLASSLKVSMGEIATVSKEQLNSLVSEVLIEGAPSAEWWSRQSVKLTDHFKDGIRQGWARGESIDNILKRLTGGVDENGDPIFDIRKGTLRGAEATIRTSVQAISNDARRQVYKENADILQGVQWVSTLDTRTTIECASLDGLMWDMDDNPIDHDMVLIQPPRHWNCRSVLVPVTKSFEELGFKEYEDFDEGERSSIDGQVPASKTFDKWLSEKPQSYAEEVFGVERAKLWSEGKISVRDMVNQQGNPLTLDELRKKIA